VSEDKLAPYLERVHDEALRHSLAAGVGLLHDTMDEAEQDVVNLLFESGALQARFGPGCHPSTPLLDRALHAACCALRATHVDPRRWWW